MLDEAWAKYRIPDTNIYIKGGQIKDPLAHEQIVSSKYQVAVERSLQADIFANGDAYVKGASIQYFDKNGPVRAELAYTGGLKAPTPISRTFPTRGIPPTGAGRLAWSGRRWATGPHITRSGP